ncbi:T9SS type A sorting domain-containing protein [Taibaiella chishuiensis]|uniref:Putative secreted protein (Por secretion system target) n=1 Tax=Taibaiella chishuiensis TaxID=1434707 RepID=A0A2P8DCU2_9BACT|nr:T9SS type A sorting domain-containing protein [Taibaiella chishuiensis]PSK95043.1 putative secreted protein (Por secretion system target) [Taibaiella chishuiensis]
MKRVYALCLFLCLAAAVQAQPGESRLPQTLLHPVADAYIPVSVYPLPDWGRALAAEQQGISVPFRAGLPVSTDIRFPASGAWTVLPGGRQVWQARVQIAGAPAIGFYYDQFALPEGAALFVKNKNGRQLLGAYTSRNNTPEGLFAHEALQGDEVTLELDLEAGVPESAVRLHINQVLVYFRAYEYLNRYEIADASRPTDADNLHLEGGASLCHINAVCPLGMHYPFARKATVQTVYPNGNLCSATLVNNTGNSTTACKPYLLTATHCEETNSTANTAFAQMLIRFNFEKQQCTSGPPAEVNTLTGAYFRARSNYIEVTPPSINGDFLLLELKDKIPAAWDAYLSGWNRDETLPATLTYPKRYIGFHHPAGDAKKIVTSTGISPEGDAGGSMGPGTHWQMYPIDSGGIEGGSSGSGLFDGEGRLVGIASVAGGPSAACTATGQPGRSASFYTYVQYSKLNLDWDYSQDGADAFRKLKPWLDPQGTGTLTLDAVKSDCSMAGSSIVVQDGGLPGDAIAVGPNPLTQAQLEIYVRLAEPASLQVDLFDVRGIPCRSYVTGRIQQGRFSLDMSGLANGMYLVRFNNGKGTCTKKIMLSR